MLLALLALRFSQNMSKWNWQISSCLVISQMEACALPPTNYNVKGRLIFLMTLDTAVEFVAVEEVPCQFREGNVATRRMLS